MTEIRFRPMQAEDLDAVLAIEQRAFSHPWSHKLYTDALTRYQCWIMERGAQHIGHAVMQYIVDEAHLLNIVIGVEQQSQGYGRQLLEFVLEQAEQQGSKECYLELRQSNHAAYALYEQLGFNEIGRRNNYYPAAQGQEDAIVMACTLGL